MSFKCRHSSRLTVAVVESQDAENENQSVRKDCCHDKPIPKKNSFIVAIVCYSIDLRSKNLQVSSGVIVGKETVEVSGRTKRSCE